MCAFFLKERNQVKNILIGLKNNDESKHAIFIRIELNKEKQVYCLYLLLMVRLVISGCLHAWHLITVPQKSNNCKSLALCLAQWLSSFFFFSLYPHVPHQYYLKGYDL